jgi:cyclase
VKSIDNIQNLLKAGADKVSINSAAILDPNIIKKSSLHFGSQCIVVAVDVKKNKDSWTVFSHGGTKNTGIDAIQWLKRIEKLGAGEILLTSMDKDGTKTGFDLDILLAANKILNIPVIASGGVGSIHHFYEGIRVGRADALLAASVFHFNEFSIMDVKNYLKEKNIKVRI